MKRLKKSALWGVFLGEKKENLLLFLLIFLPGLIAAFSEGISFSCILAALTFLKGESLSALPVFHNIQFYFPDSLNPFSCFIILAVAFQIFRSCFTYVSTLAASFLAMRIQTKSQSRIYEQIINMSFRSIGKYKLGDLIEYIKTPAALIQEAIENVNKTTLSFLAILASAGVMLYLSIPLTGLAILIFGVFGVTQKITIKNIGAVSFNFSEEVVEFAKYIAQTLQGIKIIHIFNRQKDSLFVASQSLDQISRSAKRLSIWNHSIAPLNEIFGVLVVCSFLVLGQLTASSKDASTLPVLLTFLMILHRLNNRVQQFVSGIAGLAAKKGQLLRFNEILRMEDKEFTRLGGEVVQNFKNQIVFKGVGLKYDCAIDYAVKDVRFSISKGATVAIVGHSGSGKSSLMDLLLCLFDPTEGVIEVDGIDIKQLDITSWRNLIGVVTQDSFIFNDSVENNILFGNNNASFEQVVEAAKIAGAHAFIERLPEKYQTFVGERGHKLSGGERQRIALARAIIRDPEILILDEATSSLDSYSEYLIQSALDRFNGIKTIVVVAHRLSTIVHADHIIVFDKGKVVEMGSHTELLEKKGKYAFLWDIQTKKSSPAIESFLENFQS